MWEVRGLSKLSQSDELKVHPANWAITIQAIQYKIVRAGTFQAHLPNLQVLTTTITMNQITEWHSQLILKTTSILKKVTNQ